VGAREGEEACDAVEVGVPPLLPPPKLRLPLGCDEMEGFIPEAVARGEGERVKRLGVA